MFIFYINKSISHLPYIYWQQPIANLLQKPFNLWFTFCRSFSTPALIFCFNRLTICLPCKYWNVCEVSSASGIRTVDWRSAERVISPSNLTFTYAETIPPYAYLLQKNQPFTCHLQKPFTYLLQKLVNFSPSFSRNRVTNRLQVSSASNRGWKSPLVSSVMIFWIVLWLFKTYSINLASTSRASHPSLTDPVSL